MYVDVPKYIDDFLKYMQNIQNRSKNTVSEYYYDLRDTFRFIKLFKENIPISKITSELISETDISKIDINFIKKIELTDLYEYLSYITNVRLCKSPTRARKVASLKSFFNYLTLKQKLLDKNPTVELETPKLSKRLPKYLTLDESIALLHSIDGKFQKRDYCIITLFLNCGLRLSELVSINIKDIKDNVLTVIGKGDKERLVYLNRVCQDSILECIATRPRDGLKDRDALFISERKTRIGGRTVELMVKKFIEQAGLDPKKYTPHKLRHTAATLMHKYGGVDIRALQQILGHESISTTEIYTHIDSDDVKVALESNPLNNL